MLIQITVRDRVTSWQNIRGSRDRNQKYSTNGHLLNTAPVTCGAPQGSNLGPLLFLVYINDLPNCLTSASPRIFADDTIITFPASTTTDLENAVNLELRNLQRWLITNRLSLNIVKTQFIVIGSNQRSHALSNNQIDIEIDGKLIRKVFAPPPPLFLLLPISHPIGRAFFHSTVFHCMKNSIWRLNFLPCERSLEEISPALQANLLLIQITVRDRVTSWQNIRGSRDRNQKCESGIQKMLTLNRMLSHLNEILNGTDRSMENLENVNVSLSFSFFLMVPGANEKLNDRFCLHEEPSLSEVPTSLS